MIHIPKEENMEADALANLGSATEMKGIDFNAVVAFNPICRWLLQLIQQI